MFEFSLFNIIQNAVKYNVPSGHIVLSFKLEEQQEDRFHLQVQIMDTGVGIAIDRQNLLFKPFMELNQKEDLRLVKDNSIGLGLTCSHAIIEAMGGQLELKSSLENLTVFSYWIPVKIKSRPVSSLLNSNMPIK